MNMIRFLVALFLTFGLPLFAAQSNYVPVIGTQPVSPVIYAANPLANFATTNPPSTLTNIVRDLITTYGGGSGSAIANNAGLGTNTALFSITTTNAASTNLFYGFGSSDPLVNGTYALTAALGADGQALYTNMNGSGRAMVVDCCASDFNSIYSIVQNTNGDISTWGIVMEHNAFQPGGAWVTGAGTVAVPFSDSGWGTWHPPLTAVGQPIFDGLNATNLYGGHLRDGSVKQAALASGITVPTSQTVSNKFIHIRTNGITINNTNWIYQGNVSGSRVTITNSDFYAYSTNGAFANVRYLDQILFQDINVQCLVHQKISANKVQCWQLNVGHESKATAGITNTANWYLIPYLFKLTDFTVGGENFPTVFNSNGSLDFSSIDNQGSITLHYAGGSAITIAADTSPLAGLQMGPNGMYFEISGVGVNSDGSGFVNAQQFVLPAETVSYAQMFATNGSVTFPFGLTNILGGNVEFRSKAVAVAGFAGSGAGLTNLPAQTNSNTALLNRDPQTFTGANTFSTVSATTLIVTGAVGLNGPVTFTNTVTHQGLVTNAAAVYGNMQTNSGAIKASEFVGDGSKLTGVVAATGAIASTNGFGTNATFYSTGPPAINILPAPGQSGGTNTFGGANIMATNYAPIVTITNAIVLGTRYSNGPQRAFIRAAFTLNAAVAGTATVTLYVEGNVTNKLSISSGPLASLVVTDTLADEVGPGEVYYFANESSGSGATVAFVANTFAIKLH